MSGTSTARQALNSPKLPLIHLVLAIKGASRDDFLRPFPFVDRTGGYAPRQVLPTTFRFLFLVDVQILHIYRATFMSQTV